VVERATPTRVSAPVCGALVGAPFGAGRLGSGAAGVFVLAPPVALVAAATGLAGAGDGAGAADAADAAGAAGVAGTAATSPAAAAACACVSAAGLRLRAAAVRGAGTAADTSASEARR
jgi:hypothetical protein